MTNHLTREQLLNYLDGELPKVKMRAAEDHVQACWACRSELDHLRNDISLIYDAQKQVLLPGLPPPPQPWPRLEPRLDATVRPRFLLMSQMGRVLNLVNRPVPVVTFLTALVALIAFLWFSPASVSAKEVLRRVSEADGKRMVLFADRFVRERVRVTKTSPGSHASQTGRVDSWKSAKNVYWKIAPADTAALNLQQRYRAQKIADVPLSSPSYEAWVNDTGVEGNVVRRSGGLTVQFVSSRAVEPEDLKSMDLNVRQSDWHVTSMELNFVDARFDVTEEEFTVLARSEVPADVLAKIEPPEHIAEPPLVLRKTEATSNIPKSPAPNLDDVEVDVRYALHQIGSDLGDPIEIVREDNQIVVRAAAVPLPKRDVLMRLLQGKPDVRLDLRPPISGASAAGITPQTATSSAPGTADPEQQAEQERLAKWFGDPKAQEAFARSVVTGSTALLARLYAIKQLTDRWPVNSRDGLSDISKERLTTMIHENTTAASQLCIDLTLMVRPLINDLTGDLAGPVEKDVVKSVDTRGQDSIARTLEEAKDIDLLLRSVLTTSARRTALIDGLHRLRHELGTLDSTLRSMIASKP